MSATTTKTRSVRRGPRQRAGGDRKPDFRLLQGECVEVMEGMRPASIDAVVCDPPYAISFQDEGWDGRAIVEAAARAGHGGLSANEAFEVWCGIWGRECLRVMKPGAHLLAFGSPRTYHRLVCGLEDAGFEIRDTLMWLFGSGMPKSRRYRGDRATALKPAFEPIVLARKPPAGTIEENVRRHGTGLLEVGECRTGDRHPADLLLSHEADCEDGGCAPGCAVALLDASADQAPSRFFYCPKASRVERDAGCEDLPRRGLDLFPNAQRGQKAPDAQNNHPTVKPLALMRWAVRLICPRGGLLLDPFAGSGSTGAATVIEGRRFRGIELEADYIEIAAARIAHWAASGPGGPSTGRPSDRGGR